MSWVENAIWWQVYPLGFCQAPIRGREVSAAPRLRRLPDWLDYAIELGASGLLLGPVFASQTHGYDSTDQFLIDPRLGDQDEFNALVKACRQRGLRILLDGVFSHVGAGHPAAIRALNEGPDGELADLFDIDWDTLSGPTPRVFEGHSSLIRLNHGSEKAVAYTVSVLEHWLAQGIDGWRLDAAYSVRTDFWAKVLGSVRSHYPDAWFLGEVIHGDYAQFIKDSTVDSVTQYQLWKAIWSSIKDRNLFELDWALQQHNKFLSTFIPNTFIGNHDVTRIASLIGPDGAATALAVLLTLGGIPSIYYGDEQGFTGIKEERLGGDDEIRPAFPEDPAQLAPWGETLHRTHQELIGLRRRHPWLTTALTNQLSLDNTHYHYRTSATDGSNQHIEVEINLAEQPSAIVRDATGHILWMTR